MTGLELYFFSRGDTLPKLSEDDQFPGELVGAWTTMFGRLDQASKCTMHNYTKWSVEFVDEEIQKSQIQKYASKVKLY